MTEKSLVLVWYSSLMPLGCPAHTHNTGWGKAGEATAAPAQGALCASFSVEQPEGQRAGTCALHI